MALDQVEKFRESLPDVARDIKINLSNVLTPSTLSAQQTWGVALAASYAAKNPALSSAILADAVADGVAPGTLEDAKAAAVLMGMNNVYYRFRHVIGKESYSQKPARLRMMRIQQVAGPKAEFELYCMAVSAINNCEACMRSHEAVVLEGGLTEDHVHDAVRVAAVISAAAVAGTLT
jgi:lipoyl-dependent peroxiredoxin subunit D